MRSLVRFQQWAWLKTLAFCRFPWREWRTVWIEACFHVRLILLQVQFWGEEGLPCKEGTSRVGIHSMPECARCFGLQYRRYVTKMVKTLGSGWPLSSDRSCWSRLAACYLCIPDTHAGKEGGATSSGPHATTSLSVLASNSPRPVPSV